MKLGTPPSRRIIGALLLGAALRTRSSDAFVGDRPISATTAAAAAAAAAGTAARTTPTSLGMVRNRGLERRVEGATPMPGGMTLYVKPGMDGSSVGDCPFAHFVRMVLAEKGLEYDLVPSTHESKPRWLVDDYSGKMPALRHRKECYVDSDVIVQYLDFFFPEPELSLTSGPTTGGSSTTADDVADVERANAAAEGFLPAMARYVKHRPNGDDEDDGRRASFERKLRDVEDCLSDGDGDVGGGGGRRRTGPYLVGDGARFTLLDCSMAPKLYAMDVCLRELKGGSIDVSGSYPRLREYMDALFDRPSFRSTAEYGPETIVWGWTSHLNKE